MSRAGNKQIKRQRSDESVPQELPPGVRLFRTLEGHKAKVTNIAFDPRGERLVSGSSDGAVRLWETHSGKLLHTIKESGVSINGVAFDPEGKTIASASGSSVTLWEARNGKPLRTLTGPPSTVFCIAFEPKGEILASGGAGNDAINLWDTRSGKLLRALEGHMDSVFCAAFNPQGETLASGSADHTVRVWNVRSGQLIAILKAHQNTIWSVAIDSRGQTLASASADRTLKLWELSSGKLLRTLEGHTGWADGLAFSSDGRLLASKSDDQTIRLWNCANGEPVCVIAEPTENHWTHGLAFHPTLPLLAVSGSAPGTPAAERSRLIHIWEFDVELLLGKVVTPTITYASAKVVLVGESNVGKSYLAHHIATGAPPAPGTIASTHGMRFWPLELHQPSQSTELSGEKLGLPAAYAEKLFGKANPIYKNQRRDIVLWDMGGQEEYRLVHQLFLHDTTVALVLLDPTRGATAFMEVEAWNKSLEKQLGGRNAVKILVGAKVDRPSKMIDYQGLERLRQECGFADYCETSAITGRGVDTLCAALGRVIDWSFGETSRPELFQAIRDEIEKRRKDGVVVILFDDLDQELQTNQESPTFSLMEHDIAMASDAEAGTRSLDAVCDQLAQQGIVARARMSSGKSALILRIEEVERYGGSLILAAKANRNDRGVPALELRAIAQEQFHFPEIAEECRLPRSQEKSIVECTVQLMLEHGICFQHEGLLIFPSLFDPTVASLDDKLPHTVSLYYDFAGAIDNIYASLVAWLVLAKEFGKVRLWSERAEFEVKEGGVCGLVKRARPGGFAHVDVYFENNTAEQKQKEFISFVEDHLARNGVEIREHVAIKCACGHEFGEDTLRLRIARGDKDVVCSVCETRHSLIEGATVARERDTKIAQHTWALRTQIEKWREKITQEVVQVLGNAEDIKPVTGPLRLLHLSDLHFTRETPVPARLQWLLDDLKLEGGLGFKQLDYLVVSGDFTDKGSPEGFDKAYEFVSGLTQEFGLSAERCIFVPGNHDVVDRLDAYTRRKDSTGLKPDEWFQEGKLIMACDPEKYPLRFKPFSDSFYHNFVQRAYPAAYADQGVTIPFWDTGVQFLTLNSCWQIDEFHRKRSAVHVEAVANAIKQAQKQEAEARQAGQLAPGKPLLRIGVWHHALAGPEQMKDTDFVSNLQKNGVRLALHGDVHEMLREQVGYRHKKAVHVVGSGSFGARAEDRPESMPRLYNVLEIARDLKSVRVHTRCQPKPDGPWSGWYEWEDPIGGQGRVAFYDLIF